MKIKLGHWHKKWKKTQTKIGGARWPPVGFRTSVGPAAPGAPCLPASLPAGVLPEPCRSPAGDDATGSHVPGRVTGRGGAVRFSTLLHDSPRFHDSPRSPLHRAHDYATLCLYLDKSPYVVEARNDVPYRNDAHCSSVVTAIRGRGPTHSQRSVVKPRGYVVYDGPSRIDGSPIVVIVTGLQATSQNDKTGAMAQSWIIRSDVHPVEARRIDADSSVCGDCPLALSARHEGMRGPRCYVNVGFGPSSVYRAFVRGVYPAASAAAVRRIAADRSLAIRIGSYGDPRAAPNSVWQALGVGAHTGYTHGWQSRPGLRSLVMASADTLAQAHEAWSLGWRTFRVISDVSELQSNEILCPASAEADKRTHCADCLLCDGSRQNDKRKSIAIVDHGPTAKRERVTA